MAVNIMDSWESAAEIDRWTQAVNWFLRVRSESACEQDLLEFERWSNADPHNTVAYQQVVASWDTLGRYAAAPGIVAGHRDALADSQRTALQRATSAPAEPARARSRWRQLRGWSVAACLVVTAAIGTRWLVYPPALAYATDRGEQRTVRLSDGSVVALDADSRVRIRYQDQEREIVLERGQARFSVAKDPQRPFRVHARGKTVVALGTQFDVDLASHAVQVTLLEGHVAITGVPAGPASPNADPRAPDDDHVVELTPGEALKVSDSGASVVVAHVDVTRVTAWQTGKIFFDNEPLSSAVERIGRYAQVHFEVDPSVSDVAVSGVFKTSDPAAFIEAITRYFAIDAVQVSSSRIVLTRRKTEGQESVE
jgi:transmembrane sensor